MSEHWQQATVQCNFDETLREIAYQFVEMVCNNVTIEWTLHEDVQFQPPLLVGLTSRVVQTSGTGHEGLGI